MKSNITLSVDIEQIQFIKENRLSPTRIFRDILTRIEKGDIPIEKKWKIGE